MSCRWCRRVLGALLCVLAVAAPAVAAAPAQAATTSASTPATTTAPTTARTTATVAHVVVIGVPGLRWSDVTAEQTPALWRLAGHAALASMTDRTGEGTARRAAGWLTLNTGTRARADVAPDALPDPHDPQALHDLQRNNERARYHADVGALGDALHRAGLRTASVGGPGALLGVMGSSGGVDVRAPSVTAALARADVIAVELPQLYAMQAAAPAAHLQALRAVDRRVGRIVAETGPRDELLVVGVSDPVAGPAHLHVAMAAGPALTGSWLTSASTGRPQVVQLIDVAPTVLWLVGAPVPARLDGARWQATGPSPTAATTAQRLTSLVDLDHRSRHEIAVSRWFFPAVTVVALLYVLYAGTLWLRRRTSRWLQPVGAAVAAVPVASWLVQTVPWWQIGDWILAPLTIGFALVVAALTLPVAGRPWGPSTALGALTAAVIAVDAATGSPLSLDAPFGDNPIIAGRFHGIGNVAFALLAAGSLLLAAGLARATTVHSRSRPTLRAVAVVLIVGAATVFVDGYPGLGDDFGGVLALLPAVVVLALAVSQVRLSAVHVVGAVVAGMVTATAFALYDYSRPAAQRTHLGRFVGQIADGSAGEVVHRKLNASLATFTGGTWRWVVAGWLVLAAIAVVQARRGRLQVKGPFRNRTAGGLIAALTLAAVLGAALNDSGLAVTAFVFFVAAPLVAPMLEPTAPPPATTEQVHGTGRRPAQV